jgi:clan AA aspartic protease (TIGR02281 family)
LRTATTALALLFGGASALLAFLALLGLSVHRHADPMVSTMAGIVLVLFPPIFAGFSAPESRRMPTLATTLLVWSWCVFLVLPVYFPGERGDALRTGFAMAGLGTDLADGLEGQLPAEPEVSSPELAAATSVAEPEIAPTFPLDGDALALPYEGEGRRMAVPVVFGHDGRELELTMMFDTGATFTTLSLATLRQLGLEPGPDAPTIELHTANGVRESQLVRLDEVWLGNLRVANVAIATCDACESENASGLLGLNVSGGFNLQIDADRKEVVFHPRTRFDRKIDVKAFVDLGATFTRFPGDRVEVSVTLENLEGADIDQAAATIECPEGTWRVDLGPVPANEAVTVEKRLPRHAPCEGYQVDLLEAYW